VPQRHIAPASALLLGDAEVALGSYADRPLRLPRKVRVAGLSAGDMAFINGGYLKDQIRAATRK